MHGFGARAINRIFGDIFMCTELTVGCSLCQNGVERGENFNSQHHCFSLVRFSSTVPPLYLNHLTQTSYMLLYVGCILYFLAGLARLPCFLVAQQHLNNLPEQWRSMQRIQFHLQCPVGSEGARKREGNRSISHLLLLHA